MNHEFFEMKMKYQNFQRLDFQEKKGHTTRNTRKNMGSMWINNNIKRIKFLLIFNL